MQKTFLYVIAALTLGLTVLPACGSSSVCDKGAEYAEKCPDPQDPFDKNTCEEDLDDCTDADQEKIEAFFDCALAKPCNDPGLMECLGKLEGISEACMN